MRANDIRQFIRLVFLACTLSEGPVHLTADQPALGFTRVSVVASDPIALEGVSSAAFTVLRSGDTATSLTVGYALAGTASNGVDYARLSGAVTIPAGSAAANVVVQPLNNGRLDPDRTVVLKLAPAATYLLGSPRGAIVRIRDNRYLGPLPGVTLTSPTNGAVLRVPPFFQVTATATSTGDPIRAVDFYADAQLLHRFIDAPYAWTWTNPSGGSHVLTAVVTDQSGATNQSKPVSIRVLRVPPAVKWISPTNNAKIYLPAVIPLAVQVTNDFGQIAAVRFYATGRLLGSVTNAPYSLPWSNPAPAFYNLEARAVDNSGLIGAATEEIVVATNRPPSVNILNPPDITTFRTPSNFPVEISASDPDDAVRRIELFANGISLAVFTNSQPVHTFQWRKAPPANYTLTATATDASGLTSTSMPVRLIYSTAMIVPEAQGTLTAQAVINGQSPPAFALVELQNGVQVFRTTTRGSRVNLARGYAEFAIPSLPGGLLNATLVIRQIFEQGMGTVDLSDYPADLVISTNDFGDVTTPLAALAPPGVEFQTLTLDLTSLVQQFAGGNLGFQFRLADELAPPSTNQAEEYVTLTDLRILLASRTNLPPAVRLVSPTNNTVFSAPANLQLWADATDADGTVRLVQFFAGTNLLGAARTPVAPRTFRLTWINPPTGSYDLTAVATDNQNASSTSSPVHITVKAASPQKAAPRRAAVDAMPSRPTAAPVAARGPTADGAPVIESMTSLSGGAVQLTIAGPAGRQILIEVSSNFADWSPLAVVANRSGIVDYTDASATTAPRRFYRVQLAE